jgi:hypothetical protein
MRSLASLFSRRVPVYIWLPIVLACAAVGFIASTLQLVRLIPSTPQIPRSEGPSQAPVTASPVEEPRGATGSQPSRVLGPPHETPSIVVATDERLFICDASVFTSQNDKTTTLSIMAFAWCTSEFIVGQMKAGKI